MKNDLLNDELISLLLANNFKEITCLVDLSKGKKKFKIESTKYSILIFKQRISVIDNNGFIVLDFISPSKKELNNIILVLKINSIRFREYLIDSFHNFDFIEKKLCRYFQTLTNKNGNNLNLA